MSAVRNILRVYRQALPTEVESGTLWYADARDGAQRIADKHGVPLRISVGVVAALSPNNKWVRNLGDADRMMSVFCWGGDASQCTPSTYTKMRDKAWSILDWMPDTDDGVVSILNGQKIVSFFQNIMGHDTCTIDGHAINIARGKRLGLTDQAVSVSRVGYKELQEAYRKAGKRVGLRAYEIQAITWVAWKRIHNI
jgi:hypothetical protein